MQMQQVISLEQQAKFMAVPDMIYKDDPQWIKPLDKDILEIFDEKKNKTFRFGKIIRWVLTGKDGVLLGRIAAFVNKKYKNKGDEVAAGGIGFFECINNQEAANLLFEEAKKWLEQEGMGCMDGPINFGERDRWWGLLTHGFTSPLYGMNYNPPYYRELFEQYGFQVFYNQVCLGMHPKKKLDEKIWQRHDAIAADPAYSACPISKNNLQKFATDFSIVYNKAWAGHGGLKELSKEQVLIMFKKMKPVMDERIIWFAYHADEPIGIFINLPDLNQWFKYLDGKFGLFQKLKFLWVKQFKPNRKFTGLVFGIVPAFQGKGLDAYIIAESAKVIQRNNVPYTAYEMQWIGDFNPKMLNIAENLGEVFRSRNLVTYRYLFNRQQVFHRHPILS
ncbi:MAG: hypothetical protein NTZ41_05345 [Sphingobacteriales bacterium]|nr:hypothetical protein [Sphingobacteriales bacterium]